MDLSTFTYKIILIFFPGIISFIIFDLLSGHKEYKTERFFLLSFVFGIASYFLSFILYYFITFIICCSDIIIYKFPICETFRHNFYSTSILISNTHIFNDKLFNSYEFFISTILSIVFVAPVISYITYHKLLFKISRKYNITNDHGHIDVLSFLFNSKDVEWIVVRDKETEITYQGWLHSFSDGNGKDEMLLSDVKVYKNDGAEIYETEWLYLSYKPDKIIIESPNYKISSTGPYKLNVIDEDEETVKFYL